MTSTSPSLDYAPSTRKEGQFNQQELWRRYSKSGAGSDTDHSLVEQYLPLVKTVVGRLALTLPSHICVDDLYGAGLVGLLNAVRRFDPKGGSSFEAYARVRIRGAIFDELRRLDWVPRSVHDKAKKVEQNHVRSRPTQRQHSD
jgi:RNA polymerase sigma factor for flagellar operon FliA